MTRKKKIFFARNEVAPTPEPSKCLAEHRPNTFYSDGPSPPTVISTGRNYPPILLYRLLLDVLFKLYLSFICSGEISALEKVAEISPLHTGFYHYSYFSSGINFNAKTHPIFFRSKWRGLGVAIKKIKTNLTIRVQNSFFNYAGHGKELLISS